MLLLLNSTRIDHIGSSAIAESISKGDFNTLVAVEAREFNKVLTAIKSIDATGE